MQQVTGKYLHFESSIIQRALLAYSFSESARSLHIILGSMCIVESVNVP